MTQTDDTKQAAAHSREPWHVEPLVADHGASIAICNTHQGILAVIPPLNEDDEPDEATAKRDPCDTANARRIVAAVNACKGIATDVLEQGIVTELLAALREALVEIEYMHSDMLSPEERSHPRGSGWARVYDKCSAALAKAIPG